MLENTHMIDILSFNKISKPIIEAEAIVRPCPRGKVLISVRRPDGTIRMPFGENWIENTFLNTFRTQYLTNGGASTSNTSHSPSGLFGIYGGGLNFYMQVGTSSLAAARTQTGLQSYVKDATIQTTGSYMSVSSSTGAIVTVTRWQFAPETAPASYNELGLRARSESTYCTLGFGISSTNMFNRIVTPSPISLLAGETLIVTHSLETPTLMASALPITIAAQNGMNISGQLKLVGTLNAVVGFDVSANGAVSNGNSTTYGVLVPNQNYTAYQSFGLTTASSFPAFNTAASGMTANTGTTNWNPYTANSFFRDLVGTWGSGTGPFTFRSITLSKGNVAGYQLLLDADMTKASAATLVVGLRFSMDG